MYDINGKVYTDASFVDEIVHNAKLILNGIVVKKSEVADASETEESIRQSDIYVSIKRGNRKFELLNYTYEHMSQLGVFTNEEMALYEIDNDKIPLEYRDQLFDIASKEFMDEYVELNNYYRMLNGLPDYGFEGLYIDKNILPKNIEDLIDISKPIHEMDEYQVGLLESYGTLSRIQQDNPSDLYLYHLGSRKIDIFEARTANKFDILYIPTEAEPIVANRFREIYEKERIIYLKRHYSLAYKFNSDYYDEFFIIMLLSQTVTDLISEIPEWYIRRDIFDRRTIQTLLESNGVKYFEEIPLKYQIALVRYLNKIIKFKSCTKNIYDLINIFGYDNAVVYKYYLMKNRLSDENDNYIISDDVKDMYDLFFVRVPLDSTLPESITNNINISTYNSIVTEDKWWNGPEDHDYVYESILKKNFTSRATKYMSVEVKFDIRDYQFQTVYFLNMIFNNKIDTSNLRLEVPIINTSTTFTLKDLFILLFIVSHSYYTRNNDIKITENNRDIKDRTINFGKKPIGDYNVFIPDAIIPEEYDVEMNGGYSNNDIVFEDECNGGYAEGYECIDMDGGLTKSIDLDVDGRYAWDEIDDLYDFNGGNHKRVSRALDGNGNESINFPPIFREEIVPHMDLDPCYIFKDNFEDPIKYNIDMSNRLFGFNPDADLDYLLSQINDLHSSFAFTRGYTLEDLGVENFMVPEDGSITSPDELMTIYNTNKEIYDNLYEKMVDANTEEEYRVYEFAFNYLFTMEMNEEYYTMSNGKVATTYLEYIKDQNVILYNFYNQLMDEDDDEIRRANISTYIDQVIDSMDLYMNNDLQYLYYSVSTRAWNSTMRYLSLLINFFKSYKLQFLDVNGTIVFNNEMDDTTRSIDKISTIDAEFLKGDTSTTYDNIASVESEFIREDESSFRDEAQFEYDYGDIYYDLNGDTSSTKLSYILLNGNIEYINGYTAIEDDHRINVDGEEYDGGSCYDLYEYEGFFDLDATDASHIEEYDDSYEEEYDWDGGNSSYNITEFVMDNGTALEQKFYADYCVKENEYKFDDEINYNPAFQGIICDGRYSKNERFYWQGNALYAEIDDNPMYELDGGRSFIYGSGYYTAYLDSLIKDNEKNIELNHITINGLYYYKVNPIYDYNSEFDYYTINPYTEELEIVHNIDSTNFDTYVANGLYYSLESAILDNESLVGEYNQYLFNVWGLFSPK